MTTDLVSRLVDDLAAEFTAVSALVADVGEPAWTSPTPAAGWTVRDQVAHLAFFDDTTKLSITDPAGFERLRGQVVDLQQFIDGVGARSADLTGAELLLRWTASNQALRQALRSADPAVRVPWFGPSMSLPSMITARIMESWAHGQDIADALGVRRVPGRSLRHVARLGVLTLPNSFRTHNLPVPEVAVRVELEDPAGGEPWVWGDESADNRVTGPAEDFCLVVTQRRHLADTALRTAGPTAAHWMSIAQAFAGPAGTGRQPTKAAGRAASSAAVRE